MRRAHGRLPLPPWLPIRNLQFCLKAGEEESSTSRVPSAPKQRVYWLGTTVGAGRARAALRMGAAATTAAGPLASPSPRPLAVKQLRAEAMGVGGGDSRCVCGGHGV